jgi:hypothetical protein
MSREELRKYLPDSPKEISFIGSSIVRLSSALSGGFIVTDHPRWAIGTVVMAWLGHEIEQYFKLHEKPTRKRNMKKVVTATIGLLLILFYCSSCGVFIDTGKWHLRRAEKHIRKAELHGAIWHSDTLYKMLKFEIPKVELKTTVKYSSLGRPIIVEENGVITRVQIDTVTKEVFINTVCPPRIIEKEVPVSVSRSIHPGKPAIRYWPWLLVALAAGYILGYLTWGNPRDGPVIKYIFPSDKKEKPPA